MDLNTWSICKASSREGTSTIACTPVIPGFKLCTKGNPALIYGKYSLLDADNPAVYAYTREMDGKKFLVLLNFTASEAAAKTGIDISKGKVLINNYGATAVSEKLKPYEATVIEL